jgi:hypothetical protein
MGMGQPQVSAKGRRVVYLLVVIAVAAILLFSLLASFYYGQAMDYRDAKYKAQYVLVQDLLGTIPLAAENITDAVDDDLDNGWRRSASLTASALAHGLSETSHAVQVMYPSDDDKNIAFASLTDAFAVLSEATYEAYVELSSEAGPLEEHDLSEETDSALRDVLDILDTIWSGLERGVDDDRDWAEDPYDLLDGMDVDALYYLGQAVVGTLTSV